MAHEIEYIITGDELEALKNMSDTIRGTPEGARLSIQHQLACVTSRGPRPWDALDLKQSQDVIGSPPPPEKEGEMKWPKEELVNETEMLRETVRVEGERNPQNSMKDRTEDRQRNPHQAEAAANDARSQQQEKRERRDRGLPSAALRDVRAVPHRGRNPHYPKGSVAEAVAAGAAAEHPLTRDLATMVDGWMTQLPELAGRVDKAETSVEGLQATEVMPRLHLLAALPEWMAEILTTDKLERADADRPGEWYDIGWRDALHLIAYVISQVMDIPPPASTADHIVSDGVWRQLMEPYWESLEHLCTALKAMGSDVPRLVHPNSFAGESTDGS